MDNQVTALALPDEVTFKRDIQAINNFQKVVRACMVEGQDFGVIPGTTKPSLLKPGAEKITKLLGLADKYELATQVENWEKPFFHYVFKCSLVSVSTGVLISEGFGSCNSMESKYRWREAKKKCPECGAEAIIKGKAEYGGGWICFTKKGGCGFKWPDGAEAIEKQKTGQVENDDIFSIVNTLMKMAEKRALVDAALHAGRLSEVFTQDIEDLPPDMVGKTIVEGKAKTADITQKNVGFIDLPWLQESLKTLQAKKLKDWTNAAVTTYLNSVTGSQAKSVSEAAAALTKEQAEAFVKRVQDTLQMA
jgi:hypothetical protein